MCLQYHEIARHAEQQSQKLSHFARLKTHCVRNHNMVRLLFECGKLSLWVISVLDPHTHIATKHSLEYQDIQDADSILQERRNIFQLDCYLARIRPPIKTSLSLTSLSRRTTSTAASSLVLHLNCWYRSLGFGGSHRPRTSPSCSVCAGIVAAGTIVFPLKAAGAYVWLESCVGMGMLSGDGV